METKKLKEKIFIDTHDGDNHSSNCPLERLKKCIPMNQLCEQINVKTCNGLLCAYTTGKQDSLSSISNEDDYIELNL